MARPRNRRRARRTGGGQISLELTGTQQLRTLAADLRAQDAKLPTQLRRELKGAARGAARVAKQAARRLPSTRSKRARKGARKRLRQRLATSVQVQASTTSGIRIVTKMPSGEGMLPRGMDSAEKGWRHPVFAGGVFDADTWVVQEGASWFREPIAGEQAATRRRVRAVMDAFARTIAKKGVKEHRNENPR